MTVATRTASIAGSIALAAGLGLTGAAPANADASNTPGEGKITAQGGLSVRSAPSIHANRSGTAKRGEIYSLSCKVRGTKVGGNDIWYSLPPTPNEWVSARYVRITGSAPKWCDDSNANGRNSQGIGLNLRSGPTTKDKIVGSLPANAKVDLVCKARGETIRGNKLWYQTSDRKWVTARYVDNVGKAPAYC